MELGRVTIAVAILAAVSTVLATAAAVGSSGRTSAPSQLTPLAKTTAVTSSTNSTSHGPASTPPRRRAADINYLRAQWLDAEGKIRAAGAATGEQEQRAILAKNGPAITNALNQEATAISTQARRVAALSWPDSMRIDIDGFESSSAAAVSQLRAAAANPFSYDATQVNDAIAAFNAAANVVRRDLGLPPD